MARWFPREAGAALSDDVSQTDALAAADELDRLGS